MTGDSTYGQALATSLGSVRCVLRRLDIDLLICSQQIKPQIRSLLALTDPIIRVQTTITQTRKLLSQ